MFWNSLPNEVKQIDKICLQSNAKNYLLDTQSEGSGSEGIPTLQKHTLGFIKHGSRAILCLFSDS